MLGPPIRDGHVTVAGSRLLRVAAEPLPGEEVRDLGNCLLLPRLVNSHTHLEFSSLSQPLAAAEGFPSWVREVIKWRQLREQDSGGGRSAQVAAIAQGSAECRARGCGLVGEIASFPWPMEGYSGLPVAVVMLEQLGILPAQAEERLASVRGRLADLSGSDLILGLSPHAPYSLSRELFEGLWQLASDRGLPVAMHLGETREEIAWLEGEANGFTRLQERLGVPAPRQWRPQLRELLGQLAQLERSLIIHGNYFRPGEWELLAAHRERMSLVYCPRTHRHFGHSRYPLPELIAAGVRVVVGTDSRASNPDLDLLAELRLIRKLYPEISPAEVLRMGTVEAAEALGQAERWGALCPGASSEVLLVPGPEGEVGDPAGWLLESEVSPQLLNWELATAVAQAARQ